jgi:hypothetical protein
MSATIFTINFFIIDTPFLSIWNFAHMRKIRDNAWINLQNKWFWKLKFFSFHKILK